MATEAPNLVAGDWRDPRAVSYRRSVTLMALGAIGGLAMAGYALFTAKGTSTLVVPAEDVALVNQQPVSRVDYLAQLQTLFGVDFAHATIAQRQKVLNDMIREELFVQRAKELDLASIDPEIRSAMVSSVEGEIAADAITSQPSDAKLQDYYEAHKAKYASEGTMTVNDILFPAQPADAAAQAAQALKSGAAPADVMSRFHGRDTGRVNGEEFYFAAKIHLGDRLFNLARGLPTGGVSAPIVQPDGIHVLYMVRNNTPVPFTFARARDQVLGDYRTEAINHLHGGDEKFFRKRANILLAKDVS